MREYTLDQVHIPRMYFQEQSSDFDNKRNYLSEEFKSISMQTDDGENSNSISGPSAKRCVDLPMRDATKRLRNA